MGQSYERNLICMKQNHDTPKSSSEPLGVYLHIPFCKSKCPYCDFCSFPHPSESVVSNYVSCLIRDIEIWGKKCRGRTIDTVYFGGGTPSLLSPMDVQRLTSAVLSFFSVETSAEITLECNPAVLTEEAIAAWVAGGVNRVSMGVQSAHDVELKALGRLHTWKDVCHTVEMVRRVGVDNINLDFMLGIPHQTADSLSETLRQAVALRPTHLSAYCLMLEEGTPFARRGAKALGLPDDDDVVDLYEFAAHYLRSQGYEHYEISNFAMPGKRSRHNLHTWQGREYVGLGVAAHGYVSGVRYGNNRDLSGYIAGKDITEARMEISPTEAAEEAIMLGLRLSDGIYPCDLERKYPIAFPQSFFDTCERLTASGLMICRGDQIALTEKGFLLSNQIIADLLEKIDVKNQN